MAASRTSAAVRWRDALAVVGAASAVLALLLPSPGRASTPGARTSAITSLEDQLIVTPEREPNPSRQPVLGYLHHTDEGWKLDMLPGAVPRTGPLPVLTTTADAAREDFTSNAVAPYAPLFRVDF
jgi:hypothetical protein